MDVKTIVLDSGKYTGDSPYDLGYWPWTVFQQFAGTPKAYDRKSGVYSVSPNTLSYERPTSS